MPRSICSVETLVHSEPVVNEQVGAIHQTHPRGAHKSYNIANLLKAGSSSLPVLKSAPELLSAGTAVLNYWLLDHVSEQEARRYSIDSNVVLASFKRCSFRNAMDSMLGGCVCDVSLHRLQRVHGSTIDNRTKLRDAT